MIEEHKVKPICNLNQKEKVIILGCDPTVKGLNNNNIFLESAFGLNESLETLTTICRIYNKNRIDYFKSIRNNIDKINERLDERNKLIIKENDGNVYIQNLIPYSVKNEDGIYIETSDSKISNKYRYLLKDNNIERREKYFAKIKKENYWLSIADESVKSLKEEIDNKCSEEAPVFITAECLFLPLVNHKGLAKLRKASEMYEDLIIIEKDENRLGRLLLPFYRHCRYSLNNYEEYLNKLVEIIRVD